VYTQLKETTREELAARIAREIEQEGRAELPTVEVRKVFAVNQRGTFPFNNAVKGFANRHGWKCQPTDMPPAGGIIFFPQESQPQIGSAKLQNRRRSDT